MASIVGITAKIMLICDAVLEKFATVTMYSGVGNCDISAINGSLTTCGAALVDELVTLIFYVVQLGGQLLPALGAVNGPLA